MAVTKANVSMEEVGPTIIIPFQEVMLLMLLLEGIENCITDADDCAACLAYARSRNWARCVLPLAVQRLLCCKREISVPEA